MFYANILFLLKLFAQYFYLLILPNNFGIIDLTEILPQPLLLSCFNGDFLFPTILLCLLMGILLWKRVVPLFYLFVYSVVYINRDHGCLFFSIQYCHYFAVQVRALAMGAHSGWLLCPFDMRPAFYFFVWSLPSFLAPQASSAFPRRLKT